MWIRLPSATVGLLCKGLSGERCGSASIHPSSRRISGPAPFSKRYDRIRTSYWCFAISFMFKNPGTYIRERSPLTTLLA
ncbi:hypothetical protein IE53DRAFT_384963 [Violaceomyces palustris]|uniref:Uncharacterized protein n=1 Tax=Violaceomyces palustris TaxID=1673888 RepID=A0ACD0P3M9_9BASI|nr:hypothetical protein IE53DRAFT_384963 [Violaceomyces palustris]